MIIFTNKESKTMTRPQQIFKKCVNDYVTSVNKLIDKELPGDKPHNEGSYYPFTFHDEKSVSVDSTLYEVLNYGSGDFNAGKNLGETIYNALNKAGYYMENIDGCTWTFVKN
jgi:hypothetical protein